MTPVVEPTYTIRCYISGNIEQAKRTLRRECYPPLGGTGLCVTIEPTTFIYTGGEEAGFVVGFLNYPRFPSNPEELWDKAKAIASRLVIELCQWSALLVAPDKTLWLNYRPADQR